MHIKHEQILIVSHSLEKGVGKTAKDTKLASEHFKGVTINAYFINKKKTSHSFLEKKPNNV